MSDKIEKPRRDLTGAVVPAVAVAGLAAVGAMLLVGVDWGRTEPQLPPGNCILAGAEEVGGPIDLVDGNGARVTEADFAGEPAVVYFGFTHCPDICPTSMYVLAEALAEPGGYDVTPVLISVDPARDTPEVMHAYTQTGGFPPGLIGLTGTEAQVDAAIDAFRAHASRAPIEGAADGAYNVDHSSFLYVMDGEWRTRSIVRTIGANPQQMAQCIAMGLERQG